MPSEEREGYFSGFAIIQRNAPLKSFTRRKNMKLIFVYDADAGLFNAMADAIHKALSPSTYQCHLCYITYGMTSMRSELRDFIDELEFEKTFLHRNEFAEKYPKVQAELPAVFVEKANAIEPLKSACEIAQCDDPQALTKAMQQRLAAASRS